MDDLLLLHVSRLKKQSRMETDDLKSFLRMDTSLSTLSHMLELAQSSGARDSSAGCLGYDFVISIVYLRKDVKPWTNFHNESAQDASQDSKIALKEEYGF